ncbi:3777_t:CDS:2, partial [Gigaspora margarita]
LCGRSRGVKSPAIGRLGVESLVNHDDSKAPHDHEAPSGHKNPKGHYKVAPITGDFVLAKLSNILAECNRNILEKYGQNDKVKGVKMDGQKKMNKGIEKNFKNKVFIEKFLTGNTFHNCTFNF